MENEKESLREKFKSFLLYDLRTADQSLHDVGMNVGSSVLEQLQKWLDTGPRLSTSEWYRGGFRRL